MSVHAGTRRVISVLAAATALLWGLAACSKTEVSERPTGADALEASSEYPGFVVEPAQEIGPHAFTAPVTDDVSICDKAKLLAELQSRPDAFREWARVLSLQEDEVGGYIASLTPRILDVDTPVTNHGLADGVAYPRLSVLTAGTAVLVDERGPSVFYPPPEVPPEVPPQNPPEESSTTASTTTTTTTSPPATPPPVTRCKCGNPLLPPPLPPETTTSTTTTPNQPHSQVTRPRSSSSSTTTTTTTTTRSQGTPGSEEPPGGPTDDVPPDQNSDYNGGVNDPYKGP